MKQEFKEQLIVEKVDLKGTLERFMNNEALYEKYLEKFLLDENFKSLEEHIQVGNCNEAFKCAHTLKGVSLNLGLTSIAEIIVPMVETMRAGSLEGIRERYLVLKERYERLEEIITTFQGTKEEEKIRICFEPLGEEHKSGVMKIYNYYITNTTAAFPENEQPEEYFSTFLEASKLYPAYGVFEEGKQMIGFCLLSSYSSFRSFQGTAVLTCFLDPKYVGKGVGSACLEQLEKDAKTLGIKHLIAEVSTENEKSIQFHKKHGFRFVGELEDVGRKFNRSFGIVLMEKILL